MASSDITVSGLSKIGNENAEYLVSKIRTIPGFPKEGILFRDFMPVLADARAFGLLLDALEAALPVAADEFDIIRFGSPRIPFWSCVGSAPGQGLHRSAQGWQASSGNR